MGNYQYPRVDITTNVRSRYKAPENPRDTTNLFVPFVSPKGPANEIVRIHSLSQFIDTFGELSYDDLGLTAFNIYNWLSNGGTVYAYRLFQANAALAKYVEDNKEKISAKYPGDFYNNIIVDITKKKSGIYNLSVFESKSGKKNLLEKYVGLSLEKLKKALRSSSYIEIKDTEDSIFKFNIDSDKTEKTVSHKLEGAAECSAFFEHTEAEKEGKKVSVLSGLLVSFWENTASTVLVNPLETPIELILDAGYPLAVKKNIAQFVKETRDDVIAILDSYEIDPKSYLTTPVAARPEVGSGSSTQAPAAGTSPKEKEGGQEAGGSSSTQTPEGGSQAGGSSSTQTPAAGTSPKEEEDPFTNKNLAVYEQYFTIEDTVFTDQDIYVTPTYFLSKLLAYNDTNYGRQFPTAGLNRGVLEEAKAINENPTPAKKDEWFLSRINYAEKTPREISFQCQRTHDGSGTDATEFDALSFLNNARYLCYMKHELVRVGREYLFEFNDSVTLSNMSAVLNRLVNEWVSNRTLSEGSVTVAKSEYSDETVEVTLNVRFTGTIEVISVTINIQ